MDSSGDTLNLNQTLLGIKSKYKQANQLKFQDSINFNANPDISGTTDSYKSVGNLNQCIRPKIDSVSSKHQPGPSGSNAKNTIYRKALERSSAKESLSQQSRPSSIDSRKNHTPLISPLVSPGVVQRTSKFANVREKKN